MNRSTLVAIATAAVALLCVGIQFATAQSVEDWRNASESGTPELSLVQSYHGTTPGKGNTLPKVEELKTLDGSWITWPGFFLQNNGGSRVFIQTTRPLEFTQKKTKKKIILKFKNTKIFLSNNQNPLVTIHFNTPMRKGYLKKRGKHVELVIELKVEATPTITQATIEDGYNYLFLDFPPGTYPTGGQYGNRPSFQGDVNATPSTQIMDDEIPPQSDNSN